jgi:DnaK suppressor protein
VTATATRAQGATKSAARPKPAARGTAKGAAAPAKKALRVVKPAPKKAAKPAAKSAPAKKAAPAAKKAAPARSAPAKKAAPAAKAAKPAAKAVKAKAPAKPPAPRKPPSALKVATTQGPPVKKPSRGPYASDAKFLTELKEILHAERAIYQEQATALKAEADSLALEREPGDVQFDEESGEGGTVTVDRERDLALSAQALAAVEEIDEALERIRRKSYGMCERCGQAIPKPRLRALPYARLCVACKSGGLSRR